MTTVLSFPRFKIATRVVGAILLFPLIIVDGLALSTPLTYWAILYLVGANLAVLGMWSLSWRQTKYRGITRAGCLVLLLTAVARLLVAGNQPSIKMLKLPGQDTLCLLNCLLDEQDVSLLAARGLPLVGLISPRERDGLVEAMSDSYRTMYAEQTTVPSPFVGTYLNRESPTSFDLVVIPSRNAEKTEVGVIFLHGFTGNFTGLRLPFPL